VSKKWYNLFVSIDQPAEDAVEGPSPTRSGQSSSATGSAARTVADIAASVAAETKFTAQVRNPTSFDEIYRAAEILPPAHGYTIMKIGSMLQSEHIRNLPPEVKRRSILLALEAAGVRIKDVVEDAVRRDRALDTYERLQEQDVEKLAAGKSEENRQIQSAMDKAIAEHRARIEANDAQVVKAKERFESWRLQKQREEQQIADTISLFVSESPMTAPRAASTPPPSPAKEP
jgi:Asp-tRNA(Asn)/Glu-tRNA(Gln) amidotransferase A subunit family amidase